MQFARDALGLVLLYGMQPANQRVQLPLGGPNLRFRPLTPCNVRGDADPAPNCAARVAHRESAVTDPPFRPVRPEDTVFLIVGALHLLGLHGPQHAIAILPADRFEPRMRRLIGALARTTPDFFIGGANVDFSGLLWIGDPENFLDILGQFAKPRLAFPQRRLLPRALGDIRSDAGCADNFSRAITEQRVVPGDLPQFTRPGLDRVVAMRNNFSGIDDVEKHLPYRRGRIQLVCDRSRIQQESVEPDLADHLGPLPAR